MMQRVFDYVYIAATIVFTVYGQLILKWRIGKYGQMPEQLLGKILFFAKVFLDPFILSGILAAFIASVAWMAAMSRFDLSKAYPFMSLNFVIVLVLSYFIFSESITIPKVVGMALIVAGTMVSARG